MSNLRAVRYRRLALAEPDNEKVRLLQLIADEADRGVLFTTEWATAKPSLQKSTAAKLIDARP